MRISYHAPIPNTFGLAVRAACLLEYDSAAELEALLGDERQALPLPLFQMGGGSNLLFSGDFPGTILHSRIDFLEAGEPSEDGTVVVRVGSGVVWDRFCAWAAEKFFWGPENLSAIPGEVGAAPVQNVGAYGREAKDIIEAVECLELSSRRMVVIPVQECQYGYRWSRFKGEWKGRFVVTAVRFRLWTKPHPELEYGHVREALVARYGTDADLTPAQVRDVIIAIRDGKLPDPAVTGSAGSFFRNPFVQPGQYDYVAAVAEREGYGAVPHFAMDDGTVKIPAAWLIEKCGWKGYREGNAGVYERQPLVLVNATGHATPDEILALRDKIIGSVRDRFGILLSPEVEII